MAITFNHNDKLYVNGSNVGIGTASPGAKLDVSGNIRTSTYYNFNGNPSIPTTAGAAIFDQSGVGPTINGLNVTFRTGNTPAERMRITSDGNVGIGTSSPDTKLHVNVASTADYVINANDRLKVKGDGTLWWGSAADYGKLTWDTGKAVVRGESGKALSLGANGSQDTIYINTSQNVGIGTTSPSAKLNVAGNAIIGDGVSRATSGLTVGYSRSTAYTANSDLGDANRAVTIINNQDNTANTYATLGFRVSPNTSTSMGDFKFVRTAANENSLIWTARHGTSWYDRFTIKSDGNVGIGTTSPVHKLHVDSGSIQLRDKVFYSASGNDTGSGTANGFAATLNDYHGTTLESQWTYKISITTTGTGTYNSSSYIVYRNSANTAWVSREISRSGTSSNHPELTISGNNAIIYDDHPSTYTVRYTVESRYTGQSKTSPHIMGSDYHWQRTGSDLYYTDGNVGIGTTSPSEKLHVDGGMILVGTDTGDAFNASALVGIQGTNAAYFQAKSSTTGFAGLLLGDTDDDYHAGMIYSNSTSILTFNAGNSTRLSIDGTSGNVGIGTTSPPSTVLLDLKENTSAADLIIGLTAATGGRSQIRSVAQADNTTSEISFHTVASSSTSEAMRIASNGNVGIGTTSPAYKLDVNGDIGIGSSSKLVFDDNNSVGQSYVKSGGDLNLIIDSNNNQNVAALIVEKDTQTAGSGTELFRVQENGNVGIGTTSPTNKLHVSGGSIKVDGNATDQYFLEGVRTGVGTTIRIYDNANTAYIDSYNNMRFRANQNGGSGGVFSFTGGNVGIGTTSPAYTLDVAGGVFSSNHFTTDSGQLLSIYQSSWTGNENHYVLYNAWTSGTGDYLLAKSSGNQAGTNGAVLIADGSGGRTFFGRHGNTSTAIDSSTAPLDETYAYIGATGTYFGSDVGIGTTSPSQKLEVAGTIRGEVVNVYGSTNPASTSPYLFSPATGALGIGANGSERMRIANNGRVGIGTTNPTAILTLTGTLNDNWAGRFENTNTGGYGMLVITAGSTANERVFEARRNTSTSALMVKADGNVGINDSTPSYTLDVNGTIRATGDVIEFSDARVKENVETVSNALDKVKAMRGVGYNKIGSEKRSVGVIAQEMLEVLPEVVHQDSDGMYSVAYGNLVGVLIEAMKEQQAQIDELKAMLNTDA